MNYELVQIDQDLAEQIRKEYRQEAYDHLHFDDGISYAAVIDGKVVGFIAICWKMLPYSSIIGESEAYIDIIEVHDDYRRQGIAKALIEQISQAALNHGCIQLRSWSSEDKNEAILMWKGLGFGLHPQEIISEKTGELVKGYFVTRSL